MKVFVVIVALAALILNSEAQNITESNNTSQNRTQVLNRPHWNIPDFNRTQGNTSSFNRTQLLNSVLNKNQQQAQNQTEWRNQFFDRINQQSKNRTNGRFQLLNNSLSNITSRNRTRWNSTGLFRPKRSDPKWVAPVSNHTWNTSSFNRTQLLNSILNKNQQQAQNQTEWRNQFFDRINLQSKNRTNERFQLLNNSLSNITSRNRTRWNSTGVFRPKRSDPKWVAPVSNHTWNQTTHNGDVIVGQIGYLDRLLFNQTYRKESRWWSGREKIIEYPHDLGKYGVNRQETITAIRIYNKFLDGLDSSAKILSGGVGYRYVKIKLSSPWNRGFEYLVQLFGR